MSPAADPWIRWTTTGCVALLALIAGTVSCLQMHFSELKMVVLWAICLGC
jgi:hypothetical protein